MSNDGSVRYVSEDEKCVFFLPLALPLPTKIYAKKKTEKPRGEKAKRRNFLFFNYYLCSRDAAGSLGAGVKGKNAGPHRTQK